MWVSHPEGHLIGGTLGTICAAGRGILQAWEVVHLGELVSPAGQSGPALKT